MHQSQKTLEFLQKLKDSGHWNDDYDYSEVEYTGSKNRVVIINKQTKIRHMIRPYGLLDGGKLVMENALDKNKFALHIYAKVHGNKYDYSLFNYVNARDLNIVICNNHGQFKISHNKHQGGRGCPKCGDISKRLNKKIDVNVVIKRFNEVHGDKYDYSEFIYHGMRKKSKILCSKHGVFEQTPGKHQSGGGCPKCRGLGLTNEERVANLIKANGDRYDYSLVDYKKSSKPIKIICRTHGVFTQTYNNHLKGRGCPDCYGIKTYNTKSIIKEFIKVHGKRYDYSLVNYKNTHAKLKINCKEHGVFEQSASQHKSGSNCPKCGGRGMTKDEVILEFKKVHGDKYDYSL